MYTFISIYREHQDALSGRAVRYNAVSDDDFERNECEKNITIQNIIIKNTKNSHPNNSIAYKNEEIEKKIKIQSLKILKMEFPNDLITNTPLVVQKHFIRKPKSAKDVKNLVLEDMNYLKNVDQNFISNNDILMEHENNLKNENNEKLTLYEKQQELHQQQLEIQV
jgi:hypothetical protein